MGVTRKIWICTTCFVVYELPAAVPPAADAYGHILCEQCAPVPTPVVVPVH